SESIKIAFRAVCQLKNKMVRAEAIEELRQLIPSTLLYRLTAVIAKAEVDGLLPFDLVQDSVNSLRRKFGKLGRAGNVCLIHLDARRRNLSNLCCKNISNGKSELLEGAVVLVQECPCQHKRAG